MVRPHTAMNQHGVPARHIGPTFKTWTVSLESGAAAERSVFLPVRGMATAASISGTPYRAKDLIVPSEGKYLLNIWMQAVMNAAGICCPFHYHLVLAAKFPVGHVENYFDSAYATWPHGCHGFGNFQSCSGHI